MTDDKRPPLLLRDPLPGSPPFPRLDRVPNPGDAELATLASLIELFNRLDGPARHRVLSYLAQRYNMRGLP